MKMNEQKKVYITISLYFEISDSEFFGGIGSAGYVESKVQCISRTANISDDYVTEQLRGIANLVNVPVEKVRLISKEEYDEGTEDDCQTLK